MYGVIGVLKKPVNVDTATFRTWWQEKHVPHVLNIPGLLHYVIYPLDSAFDLVTGQWNDKPTADGVAVLWFENKQAAHAAFSTEAGQSDRAHFRDWAMEAQTFGGEALIKLPLG